MEYRLKMLTKQKNYIDKYKDITIDPTQFTGWCHAYMDGCRKNRQDLYEIEYNIFLLQAGLRPAILIQDVDYHTSCRENIMDKILTNILSMKAQNSKKYFKLHPTFQGILVYPSKQNDRLEQLISSYDINMDSKTMGLILGYPVPGDIDIPYNDYNRKGIMLFNNDTCIMAMVCHEKNLIKARIHLSKIKIFLETKIKNPNIRIIVN